MPHRSRLHACLLVAALLPLPGALQAREAAGRSLGPRAAGSTASLPGTARALWRIFLFTAGFPLKNGIMIDPWGPKNGASIDPWGQPDQRKNGGMVDPWGQPYQAQPVPPAEATGGAPPEGGR